MARNGPGFINFHEKRKQYWAEYQWEDHREFSKACSKYNINCSTSISVFLHGRYADDYTNAYDDLLEYRAKEKDRPGAYQIELRLLEVAEQRAFDAIIKAWDMQASILAWHGEHMFEESGSRPLDEDAAKEILDTMNKVINDTTGETQEQWKTWRQQFEEVYAMSDDIRRRVKLWSMLRDVPDVTNVPPTWSSWLSDFRFRTRVKMKLGRTQSLFQMQVGAVAGLVHTLVTRGLWNTGGGEALQGILCRSVQDLAGIEFRQQLRNNSAPPGFSDQNYASLENLQKKIKESPVSMMAATSRLITGFIDGCLDEVVWDRICEGSVWHWIQFVVDMKPVYFILAFCELEGVTLSLLYKLKTEFEIFVSDLLKGFVTRCRPPLKAESMNVNTATSKAPEPNSVGKKGGKKRKKSKAAKPAVEKVTTDSLIDASPNDKPVQEINDPDTQGPRICEADIQKSDNGNDSKIDGDEVVNGEQPPPSAIKRGGHCIIHHQDREQQRSDTGDIDNSCKYSIKSLEMRQTNPLGGQKNGARTGGASRNAKTDQEQPLDNEQLAIEKLEPSGAISINQHAGQAVESYADASVDEISRTESGSGLCSHLQQNVQMKNEAVSLVTKTTQKLSQFYITKTTTLTSNNITACDLDPEIKVTQHEIQDTILKYAQAIIDIADQKVPHQNSVKTEKSADHPVAKSGGSPQTSEGPNIGDISENENLAAKEIYWASKKGKRRAKKLKKANNTNTQVENMDKNRVDAIESIWHEDSDVRVGLPLGVVDNMENLSHDSEGYKEITFSSKGIAPTFGTGDNQMKPKKNNKRRRDLPLGKSRVGHVEMVKSIVSFRKRTKSGQKIKPEIQPQSPKEYLGSKSSDLISDEFALSKGTLMDDDQGSWSTVTEKRGRNRQKEPTREHRVVLSADKGVDREIALLQVQKTVDFKRSWPLPSEVGDVTKANQSIYSTLKEVKGYGPSAPNTQQKSSQIVTPNRAQAIRVDLKYLDKEHLDSSTKMDHQPTAILACLNRPESRSSSYISTSFIRKGQIVDEPAQQSGILLMENFKTQPDPAATGIEPQQTSKPSDITLGIKLEAPSRINSLKSEQPPSSKKIEAVVSTGCRERPTDQHEQTRVLAKVGGEGKFALSGTTGLGSNTTSESRHDQTYLPTQILTDCKVKAKTEVLGQTVGNGRESAKTSEIAASAPVPEVGLRGRSTKPIRCQQSRRIVDASHITHQMHLDAMVSASCVGNHIKNTMSSLEKFENLMNELESDRISLQRYKSAAEDDITALTQENYQLRDLICKLIDGTAGERCAAIVAGHKSIEFTKLGSHPGLDRKAAYDRRKIQNEASLISRDTAVLSFELKKGTFEKVQDQEVVTSLIPHQTVHSTLSPTPANSQSTPSIPLAPITPTRLGHNQLSAAQPLTLHKEIKSESVIGRSHQKVHTLPSPSRFHIGFNTQAKIPPGNGGNTALSATGKHKQHLENPPPISRHIGQIASQSGLLHRKMDYEVGPDGQPIYPGGHFHGPIEVPGLQLIKSPNSQSFRVPVFGSPNYQRSKDPRSEISQGSIPAEK